MLFELALLVFLQTPVQVPSPLASPNFPITPQQGGYTILGKLQFGGSVRPVVVEVVLEDESSQFVARTNSTPNGDFRFEHVALGRYWIAVEGEKFQNVRERLVMDIQTLNFVTVTLQMRLRPGIAGVRGGPSENLVSVDALRRKIPKEAAKEYEKGLEEQRKGHADKAIEHLAKAAKIAPDYYEAHLQLGLEHLRAGNRKEAVRPLEKAVELETNSLSGRTALAKIYFEQQEFQKSEDVLSEAVKAGFANAETHEILGSACYKLNKLDLAQEHLLRAIALSPQTTPGSHLQLYNVYMRTQRPMKALEELYTYLQQFPNAADRSRIQDQANRLREQLRK